MESTPMRTPCSLKAKPQKHIMFGNILQLKIILKQRKADPRMHFACFVIRFSGCSTARAAAHLLGRPVMSQHKAGIQACVEINKKDDDRRGSLRQARKTVGEAVRVKEHSLAGIKRKQQVLDELATPSPKQKSVESSLTGSQTTGSKEVDAAIASFVY